MNSPSTPRYLGVRSSRQIDPESGLIGIGWHIDFSKFADSETLLRHMQDEGVHLGKRSNSIRLYNDIQPDDRIVIPWWGSVLIGVAEAEKFFDPERITSMGSNQRRVRFATRPDGQVYSVSRADLSEPFARRLKNKWSVFILDEFADEIERLLDGIAAGTEPSYLAHAQQKEDEANEALKLELLKRLQLGSTGLKTGGFGMEELTRELFELEGFEVTSLSTRHFGSSISDADLEARFTHALATENYLIQVKHHTQTTGRHGLQQLAAIPGDFSDYENHQLVLVTSGNLQEQEIEFAEEHDITCLQGSDLVDLILNHLDKLKNETRLKLGLLRTPLLIED